LCWMRTYGEYFFQLGAAFLERSAEPRDAFRSLLRILS
jgi:hypothetical protein